MGGSQIVPDSSGDGGNTNSPSPIQISPAIRWCFTLNNYTELETSSIVSIITENCKYAIVGKEVGESGTPHLQGYIEFKKKKRPLSVFSCKRIHWEKSKGDREDNYNYCSKGNDILIAIGVPKPIKIITDLYPYQKRIENLYFTEPDDRKVYWFWETIGNIGKTAFIKYMVVKYGVLFCNGGKYTDIMNLVFNCDMDNCKCVIFDLPRANEGKISYSSLESIKNGMVCNTKYETGVKLFNPPHLFIFANFPPDEPELLSNDRWVIEEL